MASASKGACHALVMSGGGDKGAYQIGVLEALVHAKPQEMNWDVVTGVSVGSSVAFVSRFFPCGSEKELIVYLKEFWETLKKDDVYQPWPFGFAEAIICKRGLYDSSPLHATLKRLTEQAHRLTDQYTRDRMIGIPAVNINDSTQTRWNESNTDEELIEAVMASMAVPGVFPSVQIGSSLFNDATIEQSIDIDGAIFKCFESGKAKKNSDIVIDIVSTNPVRISKVLSSSLDNCLSVLHRSFDMLEYYHGSRELSQLTAKYPGVKFRYIIRPKDALAGTGLDFEHESIVEMFAMGKRDGLSALTSSHDAIAM